MKKTLSTLLSFAILAIGLVSCTTENIDKLPQIPTSVLEQIVDLGFSPDNVVEYNDGYIVEGDIFLSKDALKSAPYWTQVPDAEQYSTFNLVTGTPRTINVYVNSRLPSNFVTATDIALARYNAENLNLTFVRTTSSNNADIEIKKIQGSTRLPGGFILLGSAGFPTAGGDPHNLITMNERYYKNKPDNELATTIAHEIGHCIGFRHTDYFNRSISCGSGGNEGEETTGIGAVHIPGTPTGADLAGNGSFMLSCANGDRPFTAGDVTALTYLY